MKRTALMVVLVAACGGDDGAVDAPPTAPVRMTGGVTRARSNPTSPAIVGARVTAVRSSDEVAIASTQTDGQGGYQIVIPTVGGAFDGYLRVELAGYIPTYFYPAAPLTTNLSQDIDTEIVVFPTGWRDLFDSGAGVTPQPGTGWIRVLVADLDAPTAGAVVTTTPAGTVRYVANGTSTPSATATVTDRDGLGFVMNVPAGPVTVTATKTGASFGAHGVTARADVVTETVVH